ncbi:MAG: head-tail connector protein [Alphaproteobacteria bacterium]
MQSLELAAAPAAEPVTLAEIKSHARIETSADDALLTNFIAAARQWTEQFTGRAMMTQSWRLWLDAWPMREDRCIQWVELPRAPLQAVSEVRLYKRDGSFDTWSGANYQVDAAAQPGRLALPYDQAWPGTSRAVQAIRIDFTAGYASAALVPEPIKAAIRQLAAHWYEHRGAGGATLHEIPYGVQALLAPYVVRSLS